MELIDSQAPSLELVGLPVQVVPVGPHYSADAKVQIMCGPWSDGLCDCGTDASSALQAFFCPLCLCISVVDTVGGVPCCCPRLGWISGTDYLKLLILVGILHAGVLGVGLVALSDKEGSAAAAIRVGFALLSFFLVFSLHLCFLRALTRRLARASSSNGCLSFLLSATLCLPCFLARAARQARRMQGLLPPKGLAAASQRPEPAVPGAKGRSRPKVQRPEPAFPTQVPFQAPPGGRRLPPGPTAARCGRVSNSSTAQQRNCSTAAQQQFPAQEQPSSSTAAQQQFPAQQQPNCSAFPAQEQPNCSAEKVAGGSSAAVLARGGWEGGAGGWEGQEDAENPFASICLDASEWETFSL